MSLRGSFQPKKAVAPSSRAKGALAATASKQSLMAKAAAGPTLAVRRAELTDAEGVQRLYNQQSLMQRENIIRSYGAQRIQTLIESSVLCLVATGAEDEVVGFASFGDEPAHHVMQVVADNARIAHAQARKAALEAKQPVPDARQPNDWIAFLRANYAPPENSTTPTEGDTPALNSFNTTWLRYLLLAEDAALSGGPSATADKLLHALFAALTSVEHVLACTPLSVEPTPPLNERFTEMQIDALLSRTASPALLADLTGLRMYSCPRRTFLPLLSMRRARIEDHDDLVPVFDAQSEVLTGIYGEFFLATLIQAQNEHQAALVAEVEGRARGLVGTTDQVDVRLLQRCFALEPYEQLRRQKTAEEEAEENSGPTPLTRLHNIFLTVAHNPAPPSQAEKERAAALAAQASKRASMVPGVKRASMGISALAGLAGLLKSEPAAAQAGTPAATPTAAGTPSAFTPTAAAAAATPGAGPAPADKNVLSPPPGSRALDYPSSTSAGADGSGSPASLAAAAPPTTFSVNLDGTNAATAAAGEGGVSPPQASVESFPAQWLLNYVETFRADAAEVAAAREAREAREEAREEGRGPSEEEEESEDFQRALEQEQAVLLSAPTLHSKLSALLAASGATQLDSPSLADLVVSALDELLAEGAAANLSIHSLVRFLELAVRVPAGMPVRPVVVPLDASLDDGTAAGNVFAITLFCLDARFESRSVEVLAAAFDLYPQRAYCLLTLPHTAPPASALNLLQHFTRVPPTEENTFAHVLYLLHRDTLATLGSLQVSVPLFPLAGPALAVETDARVEAALTAHLERLWAQVDPLVAHLPYGAALRAEIERGVRARVEAASAGGGKEGRRIAAQAAKGALQPGQQPSGPTLLAKARALDMSLHASRHSPTETLLISCLGSVVGLVLFNRLSAAEVAALRRDFALDAFVAAEELPRAEVPRHCLPLVDRTDPQAPLGAPREHLPSSAHLNVLTLVLNPLWHSQTAFIMRELMRLAGAHALYYQVWGPKRTVAGSDGTPLRAPSALDALPPNGSLHAAYSLADGSIVPQLLDAFVQVRPRRRPMQLPAPQRVPKPEAGIEPARAAEPAHTNLPPLPCALHLLTRRLMSAPKSVLNSRLLVVGCSSTSLAFLEELLLAHPDKHYSSITLLSKDGLVRGASAAGDTKDPATGNAVHLLPATTSGASSGFEQELLDRLALGARVRIVRHTLVDLRVATRTALLSDGRILPYDILVLAPGLQNQLPLHLMRQVAAQALADEIKAKAAEILRRETLARDARRRRKAQEQGLEDTAGLDAEALARLDEEIERDEKRDAKEREAKNAGGRAGAATTAGDADSDRSDGEAGEDDDSAFGGDGRGKKGGKKSSRRGGNGVGSNGASSLGLGLFQGRAHTGWMQWQSWSASGLEHWEAQYGALLAKQRALADGTLDPRKALEENARRRALAAEEGSSSCSSNGTTAPSAESFDPSTLDLTPYGLSGLYSLSSEDDACALLRAFAREPSLRDGGWLVQGACLEALTAVQGLMELGVQAANITWVHPLQQPVSPAAPNAADAVANSDGAAAASLPAGALAFLNRSSELAADESASDPLILPRVLGALSALGVQVLAGRAVRAVRQEQGRVYSAIVTDAAHVQQRGGGAGANAAAAAEEANIPHPDSDIELSVVGLIGCGSLDVDPYIFRAVHGSSLVYDGRLVLTHAFQATPVGTVYAAGPLAKFSRKYGRAVRPLEAYSSAEVGQRLAEAVLATALDVDGPTGASYRRRAAAIAARLGPDAPAAALLPSLGAAPKVTRALLPGNLVYFHAALPAASGKALRSSKVLTTVSARDNRVCRMEFNERNVLHSMTVLAGPAEAATAAAPADATDPTAVVDADQPPAHVCTAAETTALCGNFVSLLGLPASYLNRLLFRYDSGAVSDLVSFLAQPWAAPLYHESFAQLRAFLHEFMLDHRLDMAAIIERIMQISVNTAAQQQQQQQAAEQADGEPVARNHVEDADASAHVDPFLVSQLASLLPPSVRDTVQRAALRFLRQHANHLHGFVLPQPFYPGPQAKPRQ